MVFSVFYEICKLWKTQDQCYTKNAITLNVNLAQFVQYPWVCVCVWSVCDAEGYDGEVDDDAVKGEMRMSEQK